MSNRKRNVAYVKPQDPTFLRLIKEQVGYKDLQETIDLKRQKLEDLNDSHSDEDDREEEKPQIVVIKSGDLTAEQAKIEEERIKREENERPADLDQRVIFKSKAKIIDENIVKATTTSLILIGKKSKKTKDKESKELKNKLSFGDDEEQES